MNYSKEIVATADIHWCAEYFQYIRKPFDTLVEYVKEKKPLITIISGDYFNGRVNADEDIFHYGIQNILLLKQYTKYIIIVKGTFSHDYNTLDILETYKDFIDNLYLINNKQELEIEGLKLLILPEEYPENPKEYYKEEFSKNYDYIFGHGDIEGALLHNGADNSMLKGFKHNKQRLSEMAKYTIFGHFHKHQFVKENVLYTGSLARFKFGEEEDKGFISIKEIYSDTPLLEFIKTPSSMLKTITISEEENVLEIIKKYEEEQDTEIKIKIPKVEGLKKEILEKVEEYNSKIKIDYIIENTKIESELEYKEIEDMELMDKFKFMLKKEIETKKIPKKYQTFFNEEKIERILKEITQKIEQE